MAHKAHSRPLARCPTCALCRSHALRYDPYSVKALYRRAAAQHKACSSSGLEAAVQDLAEASRLEPANVHVRGALAAAQRELLEHKRCGRASERAYERACMWLAACGWASRRACEVVVVGGWRRGHVKCSLGVGLKVWGGVVLGEF